MQTIFKNQSIYNNRFVFWFKFDHSELCIVFHPQEVDAVQSTEI